jgi:hypothetical protein
MIFSTKWTRRIAAFLAATAAGSVFAGGCSTTQVQAVAAGLDAILRNLQQDEEDVSFGDWLASELSD